MIEEMYDYYKGRDADLKSEVSNIKDVTKRPRHVNNYLRMGNILKSNKLKLI